MNEEVLKIVGKKTLRIRVAISGTNNEGKTD